MDALKRKAEGDVVNVLKKAKEECPHSVKCYRRNPHHFKEYEHTHLKEFLEEKDPEFPQAFSQDKRVYTEQIDIMRALQRINLKDLGNITKVTKDSNEVTPVKDTKEKKFENKPSPKLFPIASTSKTGSSNKKMEKKTSFIPNSAQDYKRPCKNMKEKLEQAKPYNLFFTKVPKATETLEQNYSISFPELLCPSLGELRSSLQLNFMIDILWLAEQYLVYKLHKKPMTVIYGYEFPSMKEYMNLRLPNIDHYMVKMKDPFGIHHSKVGIYEYEDNSIRVVVSTANLYFEDWNHYNQGLWVSPALPKLPESESDIACAGPTGFKIELMNYLKTYEQPILEKWITLVKRANFAEVKVHLITSTPGKHYVRDRGCHLQRVGELLSKHCVLPVKTTPESEGPLSWGVIAQSSSIGSLGKSAGDWLRPVLLRSLASHKHSPLPSSSNASLSIIFPTGANVMYSHFGAEGGGCLPYSQTVHNKQKWLNEYLHRWNAERTGRSKAMPHFKSYCRVSPCLSKLAYFLLTSANMSKSAWGGSIQKDSGVYVRSYEVGVLFLPSSFDEQYFNIQSDGNNTKMFPFMYDLPLTPYTKDDEPWAN